MFEYVFFLVEIMIVFVFLLMICEFLKYIFLSLSGL